MESDRPFALSEGARKLLATLIGILLVYLIVWIGAQIRNELLAYNYIGQADRQLQTITVQGDAEVDVIPDVAKTTIGFRAEAAAVQDAQEENTEVINRLIDGLQGLGIAEKDIQTQNYNVYPRYNYTESRGQELIGYAVDQSVQVTIRDTENANQVLRLAGEVGANSVGSLQFEIDDPEVYEEQARDDAINEAYTKAYELAQRLGVKLVRVVSYNEYSSGNNPYPYAFEERAMAMDSAVGYGGGAPSIQAGSETYVMNVSVTFEIR